MLDEKLPPGLDFEYEASIASHDLDDDEIPECPSPSDHDELYAAESQTNTSPHQALHEFDTDDEADDKSPVTRLSAVAGSACDSATIMPQEHVQEIFQDVFNQGDKLVASVPLPILRRGLQNMERENIVALVRMFCSSLLAPRIPTLVKLDMRMVWESSGCARRTSISKTLIA